MKSTLFAIDKKGGAKSWSIWTQDDEIHLEHGKLQGKMQHKIFKAKPKNIGKKNERSASDQAIAEMQSRINKQMDKGYRFTLKEAQEASISQLLPMLAHDYTKVGHRITYPCYVSPKLDGVRCIARISNKGIVTLTSRGGKEYPVPAHLELSIRNLSQVTNIKVFDGELYIHGTSLQNIVSAVKKPNDLTPLLQFWIFDIPSDDIFSQRNLDLDECASLLRAGGTKIQSSIKIVLNERAESEEHAREFMNQWLEQSFEGMMLRTDTGLYEWNHRSSGLMKWKDFQDAEFKVVGFEEDALGEAVYHLELKYELNGKKFEYFKAKPRGNHTYRSVENVKTFLGNWVTVRYQQFSDAGVPIFPVIVAIRQCDAEGNPVE